MSWIDDVVDRFWERAGRGADVAGEYIIEAVGSRGAGPFKVVFELLGDLIVVARTAIIRGEPELQRQRIDTLRTEAPMFLPSPAAFATLASSRFDLITAMSKFNRTLGFLPAQSDLMFEATRYKFNFAEIAAMWQRGIMNDAELPDYLEEAGIHNHIKRYDEGEGRYKEPVLIETPRADTDRYRQLFWRIPQIGEVIRMEIRDAFPLSPADVLKQTGAIPEVLEWIKTQPPSYDIDDWDVGGGKDIMAALKQGDEWGPQSFASWWQGARKWYTGYFQKVAKALGIDPYFAMKHWEAHWNLPSWRMGRRLLWRTKYVTPEMWKQILRWNDYPPNLIDPMMRASYQALTITDTRRMHLAGVMGIPEVFIAYLDYGYRPEDAARMTAFAVVNNTETLWKDVINEVLDLVEIRAMYVEEAVGHIWNTVRSVTPTSLPETVLDRLSPDQQTLVWETYERITRMKMEWIVARVGVAEHRGNLKRIEKRIATAKRNFVGWIWTREEASSYLYEVQLSGTKVTALIDDWEPDRDSHQRLPTQHMLEEMLAQKRMSVTQFREYLNRKGYSSRSVDLILSVQEKLPTRSMLEDFWLDEEINDAEFVLRMEQLGYSGETANKVIGVLREQRDASE